MTQRDHLEHTLSGEEHDEDQVDPVEDFVHLWCLVIGLHHHGHHVKADEDHDYNIKGLFCDAVEHTALKCILREKEEALVILYLHL